MNSPGKKKRMKADECLIGGSPLEYLDEPVGDSYEAILAAVRFADEHLGVRMNIPDKIVCTRSSKNNQCLGRKCPFSITETKQDKL